MNDESSTRSASPLVVIGVVLLLALLCWQFYMGATVQEIGIPGVFVVKLGPKETQTFELTISNRTPQMKELGKWTQCQEAAPTYNSPNFHCDPPTKKDSGWVMSGQVYDTVTVVTCRATCTK